MYTNQKIDEVLSVDKKKKKFDTTRSFIMVSYFLKILFNVFFFCFYLFIPTGKIEIKKEKKCQHIDIPFTHRDCFA